MEQAEIARLTRELEVTRAKLSRTQTALEITGKDSARTALINAHRQLTATGTTTRAASALTGIARATVTRDTARPTPVLPQRRTPANRLRS